MGLPLCWVAAVYSVYLANPGGRIPKEGEELVPLALAITVILFFSALLVSHFIGREISGSHG